MKTTVIKLANVAAVLVASVFTIAEQSQGQACSGCFGYPTANAPAVRTTVFPFQQHVQPQTIPAVYPPSGTWTTVVPNQHQQFSTPTPAVIGQSVIVGHPNITTTPNYYPTQPFQNTIVLPPSTPMVVPGTIVEPAPNQPAVSPNLNPNSSAQANAGQVIGDQAVGAQVDNELVPGQIPSNAQELQAAAAENGSDSLQLSSPSDSPAATPVVSNDVLATQKATAEKAMAELKAVTAKLAAAKAEIRAMRERAIASERASKLLKAKVASIQEMSESKIESMNADFADVKEKLKAREAEQAKLAELAEQVSKEKAASAKLAAQAKSATEMARKAARTQRDLKKKIAAYEQEFAAIKKAQAKRKAEQAKMMKAEAEKKQRNQDSKAKNNDNKKKDAKAKAAAKAKRDAKAKKELSKSKANETDKKSEDVRVVKLKESLERQVKKAKQIHQRELSKQLRQLHEDGGDDVIKKAEAIKKKANKALEERIESIKKRVQTRIDRLGDN